MYIIIERKRLKIMKKSIGPNIRKSLLYALGYMKEKKTIARMINDGRW